MDSMWPKQFDLDNSKTPAEILTEQGKYLEKATKNMVYSEVVSIKGDDFLEDQSTFNYVFYVMGKYLQNYRFNVFTFSFDIALYPITLYLDSKIANELNISQNYNIEDEDYFIETLRKIFNSERLKKVIVSLMRLSKLD